MSDFVADFETTTNPTDCKVWAYAICKVGEKDKNNIIIGTNIDDFINWCKDRKENDIVYFHNLKFDSQFIISWLLQNGFKHTTEPKDRATKTFNTIINDKGLFYRIEIIFYKKNKRINKVVFQDSYKLIPLGVEDIAESFKMPINKLKIDYTAHDNLEEGSPLTELEKEYIKHDVMIVSNAIDFFYNEGLNKMTIGACALSEYKDIIGKRNFNRIYPLLTQMCHDDIKQSYRGGFTWLNPKFTNKTLKNLIVLDVNSLYPSVMDTSVLPYGTPIFFEGKYKKDPVYNLYVQMIRCQFKIKDGKIPTIQLRYGRNFNTEYLYDSGDVEVTLCLNSIDLELFFDHYEVYNLEYLSGWKFRSGTGFFTDYIKKWSTNKIKAKENKNHGLYLISKLMLNSLYGKFGTDTRVKQKIPYLGKDKEVKYKDTGYIEREGIYIPMASFITSYARKITISSAQKIMDDYNSGKSKIQFVYADTDSLHCISEDMSLPQGLDIDDFKLGAWKHESNCKSGRFIRQKCYIEKEIITEKDYINGKNSDYGFLYSKYKNEFYFLKITVAGMPKSCYKYVSFNNFKLGATYKGKIIPKIVPNGIVLENVDFTIKKL